MHGMVVEGARYLVPCLAISEASLHPQSQNTVHLAISSGVKSEVSYGFYRYTSFAAEGQMLFSSRFSQGPPGALFDALSDMSLAKRRLARPSVEKQGVPARYGGRLFFEGLFPSSSQWCPRGV